MTLEQALAAPRVAIAGGPHTGKTTLSERAAAGRLVLHTDPGELPEDIKAILARLHERERWSALSAEVVRRLVGKKTFVVEGVRVAHALRKGLVVDAVVWCSKVWPKPGHSRERGHDSMAKATRTVFDEWRRSDSTAVVEL